MSKGEDDFFAPNHERDEQWIDSGSEVSEGSEKPTFNGYDVESNASSESWDDTWDESWDDVIDPIITISE